MDNISYTFPCRHCGSIPSDSTKKYTHCPKCLVGIHIEDSEGYECGGSLQPIAVWARDDGECEIIGRCTLCSELASYPISNEDSFIKLLSISSKPIAFPPFPIEKTEEIAKISGHSGNITEYLK